MTDRLKDILGDPFNFRTHENNIKMLFRVNWEYCSANDKTAFSDIILYFSPLLFFLHSAGTGIMGHTDLWDIWPSGGKDRTVLDHDYSS